MSSEQSGHPYLERYDHLRIEAVMLAATRAATVYLLQPPSGVQHKGLNSDLVTLADVGAESEILSTLKQYFPNIPVLSEEQDFNERQRLIKSQTSNKFVVDPVDGTTNYAQGLRHSCISIAYVEGVEPRVAVVYDPYKDELFTSIHGQGAYMTSRGSRIQIQCARHIDTLDKALVLTEVGYVDTEDDRETVCTRMQRLMESDVMAIRMLGSATLNMCYVACGRADAYVEGNHVYGPHIWDLAAGYLLCKEAGVVFGASFSLVGRYVLCASTSELLHQLEKLEEC